MAIFPTFFFRHYMAWKCLLRYSRTKKHLSRLLKQEVQKVEQLTYFRYIGVNPWFWCKNWYFFNIFFLNNIKQDHACYVILELKNAFLVYKIKKFKKSKNWHFPKGVNQCFWSKNGHVSNFFFREYRPGKCLLRYFRTKKRPSRL